eukprot:g2579.t1
MAALATGGRDGALGLGSRPRIKGVQVVGEIMDSDSQDSYGKQLMMQHVHFHQEGDGNVRHLATRRIIELESLEADELEHLRGDGMPKLLQLSYPQTCHPVLMRYYDAYIKSLKDGRQVLCLLEERCSRHATLQSILQTRRGLLEALPETAALAIFASISLSVKHLHDKNQPHGSIRPRNIFVSEGGSVKVGAWGISSLLHSRRGGAAAHVKRNGGHPFHFLSPEICQQKVSGKPADIWALGCILYELLTCRLPFSASRPEKLLLEVVTEAHIKMPDSSISDLSLSKLVDSMLAKEPLERPTIDTVLSHPSISAAAVHMGRREVPDGPSATPSAILASSTSKKERRTAKLEEEIDFLTRQLSLRTIDDAEEAASYAASFASRGPAPGRRGRLVHSPPPTAPKGDLDGRGNLQEQRYFASPHATEESIKASRYRQSLRDQEKIEAEKKREEELRLARIAAFEERQDLQRRMSGVGGRPATITQTQPDGDLTELHQEIVVLTKGSKGVGESTSDDILVQAKAVSKRQPMNGTSAGKKEKQQKVYEAELAKARREAFEERMALQKRHGRQSLQAHSRLQERDAMEAGGSDSRSSRAEQHEHARKAPVAAGAERSDKLAQQKAYEAELAKARRVAFEERMALQKRHGRQSLQAHSRLQERDAMEAGG